MLRAEVNFANATLFLEYDPEARPLARVVRTVGMAGHAVQALPDSVFEADDRGGSWWREYLHAVTTAVAGGFALAGWLMASLALPAADVASIALYSGAVAAGGWMIARRALLALRSRVLDMNVLVCVAVIGAILIGEWAEAAAVMFFFSLGGMLEARSLQRTRRSIRELMDLSPPTARVIVGGVESRQSVADVALGARVRIFAGERVPLDGVVVGGHSAIDESPITGESIPVDKRVGDNVWAGSLNTAGVLEVDVAARANDSALARIIHLVEEAQFSKAPVQRLVDRFAAVYTPVVLALAVLVAIVPPSAAAVLGVDWGGFYEWFYRALVLTVIACPCALVISVPVSIVSAITRASRDGVLVKGGVHLETAARIRAVAFDKTGTLTKGKPVVVEVAPAGAHTVAEVLETAAALEALSSHPLAKAVVRAWSERDESRSSDQLEVTDFEEVPGRGVRGVIEGRSVVVASSDWAERIGVLADEARDMCERLSRDGHTVLVVAVGGHAIGVIGVADEIRPESSTAVSEFAQAGIGHVVMLTGDNERAAASVARAVGIHTYVARLKPEEKLTAIEELRARHGRVAMIGDGINDAPALAIADLAIAMGAIGSDSAIETADVALISDDLGQVPRFLALGRRTVAIIKQNMFISISTKLLFLVLAATGHATLWMAVFADVGVSLIVTLNGMRLLREPPGLGATGRGR